MIEIKLNVAGVGNDGGMLVRLDDVKPIFQSQQERIAELEDLVQMIIDAEPADTRVLSFMYQVWLRKAKAIKGQGE